MKAHDIQAALARLNATSNTIAKRGGAAFTKLASFNGGGIFLGRFSGETPWERHPNGDELLHILDGEVEVTIRDGTSLVQVTLPTGSVFIVPRGRWHRQITRTTVTLLSATPTPTQMSTDDAPATDGKHGRAQRRPLSRGRSKAR